jgi:DNA invertase Pin-like site-specific DNA recombinase
MPGQRLIGVGYVRRSQDSGSGVSEELQDDDVRRVCDDLGIEPRYLLDPDLDQSSFTLERPSAQRALELLNSGRANRLIVSKLNRITRRRKHWEEILDQAEEHGWKPVSAEFPNLDLLSDTGRMIAGMFIDQGEREYRENKKSHDRARENAVMRHGVHGANKANLGYRFTTRGYDRKGKALRGPYEVVAAEAQLVISAFRAFDDGEPWRVMMTLLRTPSQGNARSILSNKVYVGTAYSGKAVRPNAHEAIVPPELFNRVQRKLAARAKPGRGTSLTGKRRPLSKVLICATCGHPLSPRPDAYQCSASMCPGPRPRIREALASEAVLADAQSWHAEQYKLVSLGAAVNDTQRGVLEEELAKAEASLAELEAMQDESDLADWLRATTLARKRRDGLRAELEQADISRGWHGLSPAQVAARLTSADRLNSFVTAMGVWVVRSVGAGKRVPASERLTFIPRSIDGSYNGPDFLPAALALNERAELVGGPVLCLPGD